MKFVEALRKMKSFYNLELTNNLSVVLSWSEKTDFEYV